MRKVKEMGVGRWEMAASGIYGRVVRTALAY
jgi:hypothetical protein